MRRALLRAEAARLWRAPRLRWLGGLAPLLLSIVFAASMHDAARLADSRREFASAERARWTGQGAKDPHSAAHFGVWAVKPSSPLAALAPGIEPYVGLSVWLEAHKRNEMIFRPQQDAAPVMRSATSVAHMLELLGPLFAILLGLAGFAQDRERGTLRMALGNGAAPLRLLTARLSVMAAMLAAALIAPAVLCGGYALATLPDAGWQGGLRLLLWALIHYAYLLLFLLLAVVVSLRASSARAALTLLLALWLALCVILPRAASDAAQRLAPTPSYQAVRAQVEQEAPVYETAEKWEQRRQALEKANGGAPILNQRAMRLDQSERDGHAIFDRRLASFYDAVEHQDRTFGMLGIFSPTVALQTAGSALAGTDFHQHRHFIDAAEAYRRFMVNRLNGELMRHAEHSDAGANNDRRFWESIPAFDYRAPALAGVVHNLAAPLLLLLGWCAVALAGVWAAARKVAP